MMAAPPLVEVLWVDAHQDPDSYVGIDVLETSTLLEQTSSGYLTVQNEKITVISQSMHESEDKGLVFRDHLILPSENVRSVRTLL